MRVRTCMITRAGEPLDLIRSVQRALDAGVDLVQFRLKQTTGAEIEQIVARLLKSRPRCRDRILVNDRLDVALAAKVGGVHLPSDGFGPRTVRGAVDRDFLIGASAHSLDEARRLAEEGADFVFFGPVYPTDSKPGHPGVGLEKLAEVCRSVEIPVYALGGVTPRRVRAIMASGASGVAGISVFERESSLMELMGGRQ